MRSLLIVLAAALAMLAVGQTAGASAPRAQAAGACKGYIKSYSGSHYMRKFTAYKTSCKTSRSVARAFQKCRGNGGSRCHHKVYGGWSCKEHRFNVGFASFDSRVTCRKGNRVARHTYTGFY